MTKTCPDCHAEVLSTSQPNRMGTETCIECGKCDPCDEDCPNYQDKEPSFNRMGTTPELERVLLKWQKELAELEDMNARCDLTAYGQHSLRKVRQFVDDLTAAATPSHSLAGTTPEMQKMYDEFGGEAVNESVRMIVENMSPADQYDLAFKVAENVGYTLIREPEHSDSPHLAALAATPAESGKASSEELPWYSAEKTAEFFNPPAATPAGGGDLSAAARELSLKHDWCPACHRGWSWAAQPAYPSPAVGGEPRRQDFIDTLMHDERPDGSNADEWRLFLSMYLDNRATQPNGLSFVAMQIAEAIDAAQPASPLRGITDEMVNLACEVYAEVYHDDDKDMGDAMRAALKAILAAPPASPLRETCIECGMCDPCDDDCPNYIDSTSPAEQPAADPVAKVDEVHEDLLRRLRDLPDEETK